MPSGSHGHYHSSGGSHSSHSHSSSHSSGSHSHNRIYSPYVFYRHGVAYYIGGKKMGRIVTLAPICAIILIIGILTAFVFPSLTKQTIKEYEDDYNYYIEMINNAKTDSYRKTYGIVVDYFNGDEEDDILKEGYGYYYWILKKSDHEPVSGKYFFKDGFYYIPISPTFTTDANYYNGYLTGETYLLYSESEIKALMKILKYDESNPDPVLIELAIDDLSINTTVNATTDSVPMDYEDFTLEDHYEYKAAVDGMKTARIIGAIFLSIGGIILFVIIKTAIPKKGTKEEIDRDRDQFSNKEDSSSSYEDYRNKQRNQIFEETENITGNRTCEYCGKEIRADAKVCPFCGSRFL